MLTMDKAGAYQRATHIFDADDENEEDEESLFMISTMRGPASIPRSIYLMDAKVFTWTMDCACTNGVTFDNQ